MLTDTVMSSFCRCVYKKGRHLVTQKFESHEMGKNKGFFLHYGPYPATLQPPSTLIVPLPPALLPLPTRHRLLISRISDLVFASLATSLPTSWTANFSIFSRLTFWRSLFFRSENINKLIVIIKEYLNNKRETYSIVWRTHGVCAPINQQWQFVIESMILVQFFRISQRVPREWAKLSL